MGLCFPGLCFVFVAGESSGSMFELFKALFKWSALRVRTRFKCNLQDCCAKVFYSSLAHKCFSKKVNVCKISIWQKASEDQSPHRQFPLLRTRCIRVPECLESSNTLTLYRLSFPPRQRWKCLLREVRGRIAPENWRELSMAHRCTGKHVQGQPWASWSLLEAKCLFPCAMSHFGHGLT